VPWQRVINSKGEISPRPGAEEQRHLLEAEGVEFDPRGRVDLGHFGWEAAAPLSEQPRLF
jgi:methylated-DNA-protein-cysteine methyltransferase-like protein